MSYPEILIVVPILPMIYDSLLETLTKIIFFFLRPLDRNFSISISRQQTSLFDEFLLVQSFIQLNFQFFESNLFSLNLLNIFYFKPFYSTSYNYNYKTIFLSRSIIDAKVKFIYSLYKSNSNY